MNSFVYVPQEDPFARERWRDPYTDDEMARFAEEMETARSLGAQWGFGIRPGRPLFVDTVTPVTEICFSCDDDFECWRPSTSASTNSECAC